MKPIFLITLQEDDKGHIVISSDHVGPMSKAFDIGCEIMNHLLAAEAQNPGIMTVQPLMLSSELQ